MEIDERNPEKVLPNGDVYIGDFKETVPHGKGKYTWLNGTVYHGEWEEGKMTGKGQMLWPSGASYEGDFSGGYLHGYGTFITSDGSVYKGTWKMNTQHGIGRKQYQNSDVYDGCWKEGVREGSGSYMWSSNANSYIGNWKNGKMCGRGVMKWSNGDLFDGVWLNGLIHGSGCYRFCDGSYYFGTWTKGLKDGRGTFYPTGSKDLSTRKHISQRYEDKRIQNQNRTLSHSSSMFSEESVHLKPGIMRSFSEKVSNQILRVSANNSQRSTSLDEHLNVDEVINENDVASEIIDERDELTDHSTAACDREYMQGVLIKERIREKSGHKKKQHRKLHGNQVKMKASVNIFEGHKSYYLMLNLQLGIRYTVGKITPVPMREVRPSDFGERARIRMYFPRKGSQFTPPHRSIDFSWKDFCPMVFRNLREMFKLDAADYMMSICGDDGLRELSSPGKSGSIFYLSSDDRFVIKTLKRSEVKVLLRMLPPYYEHVKEHENTLITKFFGLHQISLKSGRKVRFVVMGNMFCTELRIHRRYDLKGSTHGRFTNKDKIEEGTTLKDMDLTYDFHMDKLLRESLFKQLSLDCNFLESQRIIDYSLLLGLHFRAPQHLTALLEPPDSLHEFGTPHEFESPSTSDGPISEGERSIPPRGLLLVTHEPSVSTAPGPHIRGNTLKAYSVGDKEVDLLLPDIGRLRVQLGVNMPAQANHKLMQESDSAEVELFEIYDVVLYMGVIDILQEYNLKKKLERAYKAMQFDPITISVAEPTIYAQRFLSFLEKVFPLEP